MAVENQTIKDAANEGTPLERYVNVHMGNFIHVFLTLLAVLVMVAASIALCPDRPLWVSAVVACGRRIRHAA